MKNLKTHITALTLMIVASAPAYSMAWNHDEVSESVITPSPLLQAYDALWAPEADTPIDAYKPLGELGLSDTDNDSDSHWIQ